MKGNSWWDMENKCERMRKNMACVKDKKDTDLTKQMWRGQGMTADELARV